MSMFGNTSSTHNPFAANTTSNPTMSLFGNTSSASQSLFGANTSGNASTTVFGNTGPFGTNTSGNTSTSVFGNTSPFGTNTSGNASMSLFGNTGPFGSNTSSNTIAPVFQNTSPFGTNTSGNTSTSIFGSNTGPSNPNPFGNGPTSIFGNTNNSNPNNPFGQNTFGNGPGISFNGTSTGIFGPPAATAGTSGSFPGFTNNGIKNPFGSGPCGTASTSFSPSTGSIFGQQPSNNIFGPCGTASASFSPSTGSNFGQQPSNTVFGPCGTASASFSPSTGSIFGQQPSNTVFGPRSTPVSSSSNPSFSFGQNKGSKITPYKSTKEKDGEKDSLVSISAMPTYESKCHEELRFEDYELKSTGATPSFPNTVNTIAVGSSVSLFPPQNPVFTPSFPNTPSFNLTPSSTTPSFTTLSFTSSPLGPSTTTPASNQSSFKNLFNTVSAGSSSQFPAVSSNITSTASQNHFLPSPAPSWNLNPSTTTTPSWNFLSSSSNSISSVFPSATTTPAFNQPSFNPNPPTVNPTPPTTSFTWPSFTKPIAATSPVLENQPPFKPSTDCIVAVQDPFGSQSATSHHSIGHPICYGISSIPVIDKPVTPRVSSSLVFSRHISSRPLTVRARKYNPKSDEPKVAFFVNTDEMQNTQKAFSSVIPRNNPRSMFMTDASTLQHEDGKLCSFDDTIGEKAEKNQASSCIPIVVDFKKPVPKNCIKVNPSVPKLHRLEYYTQPSIDMLRAAETSEPGFCSNVKDFVIGRHGYGWIKFEGETNIRGLNLDAIVSFEKLEVIVYENDNEKPEVGEGLNKRAEVTLQNIKCTDKTGKQYTSGKMVDKFTEKLKKVGENQGAEFISYDAVYGMWKFRVKHF